MSSHEKLSAAANDRKARLAQLKSLKRKQAPDNDSSEDTAPEPTSTALTRTEPSEEEPSTTSAYLSGRNFDPTTRNVKLGFEAAPIGDQTKTLEYKAEQLALESRKQQDEEKTEDKPLDLFKLQPKKPNWDLKRDLEAKMKPLDVQTENAIARLVRERVEGQKKERTIEDNASGEKQEVGMEGSELVEAMHLKEKEEEEERRRDAEDEDAS
jgi:coiled-coil domain-containing protein 12